MQTFDGYPGLLKFNDLGYGITQFVTTRRNPYGVGDNFNIGFSGGDISEIIENRKQLAIVLGIDSKCFVFQNQIHKNYCHIVSSLNSDNGFYSKDTAIPDTDILLTNKSGVMLITRSADCVPVLMHDTRTRAIAAVHSGREGTWLGATKTAVEKLVEIYGSNPMDIKVGIGPAICEKCYETDFDCGLKFTKSRFSQKCYNIDNKRGKVYLNLKMMIAEDLMNIGVQQKNIEISNLCTKENPNKFFSARNGDRQRFCAGIMINRK